MANYLNTETGEYPRHDGDIQLLDSNWSNGDALPIGWVQVQETPVPEVEEDEVIEENAPINISGTWTRQWSVRKMTDYEKLRKANPYPTEPSRLGYVWSDQSNSWEEVK